MRRISLRQSGFYALLGLAVPLALTGLAQSIVFFFETLFLAHLGADILAAGALVSWLFGTLVVIIYGTLSSINVLVSHQYGAKDYRGIALVTRDGLWLTLLLSIPTFILCWNTAPIFLAFGQTPEIVLLANAYFHALAWGVLPDFLLIALFEFIMGLGYARTIMVITLLSVPITLFFSYAFIFGAFGMPRMGIAGAGWGMSISYWLTLFILLAYIAINKDYRRYFQFLFYFRTPSFLWDLLRIGVPTGVMYSIEVAFFFALTLVLGSMGSQLLVANQITLQYLNVMIAIIFSISQAITVRMGHLLGSGQIVAAKRVNATGLLLSGGLMGLVAIFYIFFPDALIQMDFDVHDPQNAQIVLYAKQLFGICALFQIVEALRISLFGSLRGLKDTHFPLLISTLSYWVIALPGGYILATRYHMGGAGLWWGMLVGASIAVPLLYLRFKMLIKRNSNA